MKILISGQGAREHAIARGLARDPAVTELHAAPGNPGIGALAKLHAVDPCDPEAMVALARRIGADLIVIGPEAPLVLGVADALREADFAVFGPDAAAARIEGSKSFAKDVMAHAGVPTAAAATCANREEVETALTRFGEPYVVKADGLAAGKGVIVTTVREDALAHADACFAQHGPVVVEEFLEGQEVSLFCVTDGTTVIPLAAAQDFKRAFDADSGPNTGGMGAYSPLDWAPADLGDLVARTVAQPTIDELARRGTPFVGLLYCGLALTPAGLRVIEFNARFGDPETQVVLERLESPLGSLLLAAADGSLADLEPLRWSDETSVTVVIASHGYPSAPRVGDPIGGIAVAEEAGAVVLHAGTSISDGVLVSAGGRVLSILGTGRAVEEARDRVYRGVEAIRMAGSHHRVDIARRARSERDAPPRSAE